MNEAFQIAATGLQSQQLQVRTIANNLGNLNTTGYKRVRLGFADVIARTAGVDGAAPVDQANVAAAPAVDAFSVPMGVMVSGSQRSFDPGEYRKTTAALDLAIRGNGFIEVANPDGSVAWWRGGSMMVGSDGQLVTRGGQVLRPGITIPENAQSLTITSDGHVQVMLPGQSQPVDAGQLQMARFANPEMLESQGDNLWRSTEASGPAIPGRAGEDGMGLVAQGHVEASNVQMIDEMLGLVQAQNAYGACLKVVQAADEMNGLVNNLRR